MNEYEIPDNWARAFMDSTQNAQGKYGLPSLSKMKLLKLKFPDAIWKEDLTGIELTPEDKILKAIYDIVIIKLITEEKPTLHDYPHFSDFIIKHLSKIKGSVNGIKDLITTVTVLEHNVSAPVYNASAPVDNASAAVDNASAAEVEENDYGTHDGFGGGGVTIRKNKYRTSRKIRKSRTNRKNLRKSMKRKRMKRRNTMRKGM